MAERSTGPQVAAVKAWRAEEARPGAQARVRPKGGAGRGRSPAAGSAARQGAVGSSACPGRQVALSTPAFAGFAMELHAGQQEPKFPSSKGCERVSFGVTRFQHCLQSEGKSLADLAVNKRTGKCAPETSRKPRVRLLEQKQGCIPPRLGLVAALTERTPRWQQPTPHQQPRQTAGRAPWCGTGRPSSADAAWMPWKASEEEESQERKERNAHQSATANRKVVASQKQGDVQPAIRTGSLEGTGERLWCQSRHSVRAKLGGRQFHLHGATHVFSFFGSRLFPQRLCRNQGGPGHQGSANCFFGGQLPHLHTVFTEGSVLACTHDLPSREGHIQVRARPIKVAQARGGQGSEASEAAAHNKPDHRWT